MIDSIIYAAGELLGYGMVLGFCLGAFFVLATAGLCSVVHIIRHAFA